MGGLQLPWVDEIRYLGLYIIKGHCFKCSLNHAKRAFYRSANSIFGKIGRVASEEVVLDLISKKMYTSVNLWSGIGNNYVL